MRVEVKISDSKSIVWRGVAKMETNAITNTVWVRLSDGTEEYHQLPRTAQPRVECTENEDPRRV